MADDPGAVEDRAFEKPLRSDPELLRSLVDFAPSGVRCTISFPLPQARPSVPAIPQR